MFLDILFFHRPSIIDHASRGNWTSRDDITARVKNTKVLGSVKKLFSRRDILDLNIFTTLVFVARELVWLVESFP